MSPHLVMQHVYSASKTWFNELFLALMQHQTCWLTSGMALPFAATPVCKLTETRRRAPTTRWRLLLDACHGTFSSADLVRPG